MKQLIFLNQYFQSKKIKIIVGIFFGIFLIGFYFIFLLPNFKKMISFQSQIKQMKETMKSLSSIAKEKDKIQKEYQVFQNYFGEVKQEDLEFKTNEILNMIYVLSEETHVEIKSINALPVKQLRASREVQLAITVNGFWDNIVAFVYKIEQCDRPFYISQLELKGQSDKGKEIEGNILISQIFLT